MTDPTRNSEFCFFETQCEASGNIEVEGRKQNSLFRTGPVISVLLYIYLQTQNCCGLKEFVSFVRPRELVSFNPSRRNTFGPGNEVELQWENVFDLGCTTKYNLTD